MRRSASGELCEWLLSIDSTTAVCSHDPEQLDDLLDAVVAQQRRRNSPHHTTCAVVRAEDARCPGFTVREHLRLGAPWRGARAYLARAKAELGRLAPRVRLDAPLPSLSPTEALLADLARAFAQEAGCLHLSSVASRLTAHTRTLVIGRLDTLRTAGGRVVLYERDPAVVRGLAETITLLRGGRVTARLQTASLDVARAHRLLANSEAGALDGARTALNAAGRVARQPHSLAEMLIELLVDLAGATFAQLVVTSANGESSYTHGVRPTGLLQEYEIIAEDGATTTHLITALSDRTAVCPHKLLALFVVEASALERRLGLEADLQRTARLRDLGQLAGEVAHDVNNNLAVLRASSALMELNGANTCEPELETINRTIERMAVLTGSLLEHAKRGSAARSHVFDLNRVVGRLVNDGLLSTPPAVDVLWRPTGDALFAQGNDEQIANVALNLLQNAVRAVGPAGRIVIAAHRRGTLVGFRVEDDGTGMSPATTARAFEAYYTTRPRDGSGLGLSASKRIVEAHGGTLRIESTGPTGTCMLVELPEHVPDAEE